MSIIKNIDYKVSILGGARIINRLSLLVLAILLSRTLETSNYGHFQYILLIYRTVFPFFIWGIPASILYFYPRLEASRQIELIWQTIEILLIMAIIGGSIFLLGSDQIGQLLDNQKITPLLRIFSLYLFSGILVSYAEPVFISLDKTRIIFLISIITSIFTIGLISFLVWQTHSVRWVLAGLSLSITIKLSLFLYHTISHLKRPIFTFNPTLLKEQLAFSIPLGMTDVVNVVALNTNSLIIAAFFPAAVFAVYANGGLEIPFVSILISSVTAVIIPEFSQLLKNNDHSVLINIWHTGIQKLAILLVAMFTFFMVCAEDVMIILFSETYRDSATYFRIFLCLLPSRALLIGSLVVAMGKSRFYFYGAIGDLILNFLLGLYLVQVIGMAGPAWAVVISTHLQIGFYFLVVRMTLNVPFSNLLPYKPLVLIGLSALIAIFVGFEIGQFLTSYWLHLIISGGVCMITYGLLILLWLKLKYIKI